MYTFGLATEYRLDNHFDLLGEVLYTSSAQPSTGQGAESASKARPQPRDAPDPGTSSGGESSTSPEAAGRESVVSAGVRYHISENWSTFAVVSYDNQHATSLRVGFTFRF